MLTSTLARQQLMPVPPSHRPWLVGTALLKCAYPLLLVLIERYLIGGLWRYAAAIFRPSMMLAAPLPRGHPPWTDDSPPERVREPVGTRGFDRLLDR